VSGPMQCRHMTVQPMVARRRSNSSYISRRSGPNRLPSEHTHRVLEQKRRKTFIRADENPKKMKPVRFFPLTFIDSNCLKRSLVSTLSS